MACKDGVCSIDEKELPFTEETEKENLCQSNCQTCENKCSLCELE